MLHSKTHPPIQHGFGLTHTSPRLVRKITSPWLPLRCLWPSLLGMRMGVATSNEPTSEVRPKLLEKSPWLNKLKGEWWHIEALKSCSRTGTPEVATAQQGRSTSIEPLITVCSAPFPPTTYREGKIFLLYNWSFNQITLPLFVSHHKCTRQILSQYMVPYRVQ